MSEWSPNPTRHLHATPVHRPSNRPTYIALAAVAAIVAIVCAVIWEEKPATGAADAAAVVASAAAAARPTATPGTPQRTVEKSPPVAETMPRDGTYLVGRQIKTGTYTAPGDDAGLPCYWARLRDTSGEQAAVIAASYKRGQQVVTIRKGDRAFVTDGCGPWELMKP